MTFCSAPYCVAFVGVKALANERNAEYWAAESEEPPPGDGSTFVPEPGCNPGALKLVNLVYDTGAICNVLIKAV